MTTTGTALDSVLAALRPYWAAEAEICRTHFSRPDRAPATDAAWLARQAAKELHDGVVPRLARLQSSPIGTLGADVLARETRELHEEAAHYEAFAVAHDTAARAAGLGLLAESDLAASVAWPANAELAARRAAHARDHGRAGELATVLTEGGCSALFAAGAAVAGGGPIDDAIGRACRAVLDDEVEHLRSGLDDLATELAGVDIALVVDLAVEQSRLRLHMRQEQLDHPVSDERLAELLAGDATADDLVDVDRRLGID